MTLNSNLILHKPPEKENRNYVAVKKNYKGENQSSTTEQSISVVTEGTTFHHVRLNSVSLLRQIVSTLSYPFSLPFNLSCYRRRNPRSAQASHQAHLSTMARPPGNLGY